MIYKRRRWQESTVLCLLIDIWRLFIGNENKTFNSFIGYANKALVPPDVSLWCSARVRRRSMTSILRRARLKESKGKALNSSVYCIPTPKQVFCERHLSDHIAIGVTSVAELSTSHEVLHFESLDAIHDRY